VRELGPADDAQKKSFGLDSPAMHLVVERGGQKQEVAIGNATYGGGTHYAQVGDGALFLLKAAVFTELKNGATALTERTALAVAKEKATRLTVSAGGKQRELLQRFAEDRGKAFWADPAEPDTKLTQSTSWVDRVLRLRLVDFAAEVPSTPAALVVTVNSEEGPLGKLEMWPAQGETAVVRSSAFRKPLTVNKSTADGLLKDVEDVIGEKK
jgi:hypothetical protein